MPADLLKRVVEACRLGAGGKAEGFGEGLLRMMGAGSTRRLTCDVCRVAGGMMKEKEEEQEGKRNRGLFAEEGSMPWRMRGSWGVAAHEHSDNKLAN